MRKWSLREFWGRGLAERTRTKFLHARRINFFSNWIQQKNPKKCRKYIHSFHKLMFLWENPLLSNPTANFPLLECGDFFHHYFFSFLFQNIELYNHLFREVFPTRMRAKWMCLASKIEFGKMGKLMSTLKLGTLLGWCMNRLLNSFVS